MRPTLIYSDEELKLDLVPDANQSAFLICPEHGKYQVTPMEYLDGIGCPDCMVKEMSLISVQEYAESDGTYIETLYQDNEGALFAYREHSPVIDSERKEDYKRKSLHPVSYSCE